MLVEGKEMARSGATRQLGVGHIFYVDGSRETVTNFSAEAEREAEAHSDGASLRRQPIEPKAGADQV